MPTRVGLHLFNESTTQKCQNNAQDSKVSEGASSNAITNSSNDGSHGHVCNSGPLVVITTPLKRWTPSKCVPLAPIHVQATISPQTKAKVGQPRKITGLELYLNLNKVLDQNMLLTLTCRLWNKPVKQPLNSCQIRPVSNL